MKTFGKYTLYLLLMVSIVGLLYQSYSSYIDAQKFPPTGSLVDIGGYKLHVNKFGNGNTTIIFDAGMGESLLTWNRVISGISEVAQVFAYDRAGLGWSEKSPLPRTSLQMVKELHLLLDKSNSKGPYILVGHSFGGLNMQLFAKKYPDDVAGLVLVDSSHEDQRDKFPKISLWQRMTFKAGILATPFGFTRLTLSSNNHAEHAVKSTIKHQYTKLHESDMFTESAEILKMSKLNFGELPLTVIARNFPSAILEQDKNQSLRNLIRARLQQELAERSLNSTLIFSENRLHYIHRHQPKIVIKAIKEMIRFVENQTKQTSQN